MKNLILLIALAMLSGCLYTSGNAWRKMTDIGMVPSNSEYAQVYAKKNPVGDDDKALVVYPNGDIYEGLVIDGLRFGVGHYRFSNGGTYDGEFVNDTFHGLGILVYPDGSRYEGEFVAGKPMGDGTYFHVEGDDFVAFTAHWQEDGSPLNSYVSIIFSNGETFEGRISGADDIFHLFNDNYKIHREWLGKRLYGVSLGLGAFSLVPTPASPFAQAGAAMALGGKVAMDVTSAGIDLYDSVQSDGHMADPLKNLGKEVAFGGATFLAPYVLSKSARSLAPALVKMGKDGSSFVGKTVCIVRDKAGVLSKELQQSKVGILAYRLTGRGKHQYVTAETFGKYVKKNGTGKLELGKPADGSVLKRNMHRSMGEDAHRLAQEKLFSPKFQGAQAHHIVAGTSPQSANAREILKKCGIDINDPRNGIFLPEHPRSIFKGSIHGNHVKEYDRFVEERLVAAVNKNGYSEKTASAVLDDIKKLLYNGDLALLRNKSPNTALSIVNTPSLAY